MQSSTKMFLVIICLAGFMASCSTSFFKQGKKDFIAGEEFFNKGDCAGANIHFTESLKKNPDQWQAYLFMAECALKEADYKNMLQWAQKALSHASKNSPERNKLKTLLADGGEEALKKNEYESAILLLQAYIPLDRENSTPHLWLGNAYLERGETGDMKNAIVEFKAALNTSHSSEKDTRQIRDYLIARAKKYSTQNDYYSESRCYLAYTENFNPQDAEAYIALGKIFMEMGNPAGALYYAKKAYALEPKNNEVLSLMGELNSPLQH